MTRRRWLGLVALALVPGLVFLLWPLRARPGRITVDQAKLAAKQAFLLQAVPSGQPVPQAVPPERQPDRQPERQPDRPNVILILADDLGQSDVSLYGGTAVPTPRIDSIGRRGAMFTEGYITSPICSPSRAGLLTGRYQQRYGHELQPHDRYPRNRLEYYVFKYILARHDWRTADMIQYPAFEDILQQGLPASELTLAELMKKHGYATAIMGKWHLGASDASIPLHRGFDYHYGFYEAFSLYADPSAPDIINQRHSDFSDHFIWSAGRTGNCAIHRNNDVVEEKVYLTEKIARESVVWLEQNRDRPFFLYVPFNAPHTPFQVPRAYFDRFPQVADRNRRVYLAMISALDDGVGAILDGVERLGLSRRTLIFFLSDNGGATYTGAADNAPLRGGKFTNFEGGIRVPFLLQWEGTVPAGTRITQPVSALDVMPTVAAATGSALPVDRPYDGVDLRPWLVGGRGGAPHEALYWRSEYHKAIRQGDYKLIQDDKVGRAVLYDLKADPGETRDLAAARPEVVRRLLEQLAQWETGLVSPLWPRVMDYRIRDRGDEFYFPL